LNRCDLRGFKGSRVQGFQDSSDPPQKQADKNAKKLKTIAGKRHRRNRKNVKISDKALRKQTLDPLTP